MITFLLCLWFVLLILNVPLGFSRVGKPRRPISMLDAWGNFWAAAILGTCILYGLWSR